MGQFYHLFVIGTHQRQFLYSWFMDNTKAIKTANLTLAEFRPLLIWYGLWRHAQNNRGRSVNRVGDSLYPPVCYERAQGKSTDRQIRTFHSRTEVGQKNLELAQRCATYQSLGSELVSDQHINETT